jgi:hypothetical protein
MSSLVYLWWAFYLVWLIAVGWKLSRLSMQRGSLLSPGNKAQLQGDH